MEPRRFRSRSEGWVASQSRGALSDRFYKKGDTWPDAVDKAKKRCSFYTKPKKKSHSATGSFAN